ncbi:NAD(P)/FAD-dependent oxidoreductase [Microbacterium betulae]|uniref:NAD(P)/FAD-dependent oxidoreductase n=1 Tax=Microbacterium betulae TaxID=2981139 RepID=A0AA97FJ63_9MICO|nr:NAD(P)/FAD-dependent oxidoreductase [Microbacterium sp. AB]WOF23938.1 NAD(P)/FAD-dependent oxidoreductase [Microbacterium sp. AB]
MSAAREGTRTDVLVVGAGFAGLAALAMLHREGFDVVGVEREHEVGGTWYVNRYPGLRCDVESMHYSYSWDDDLQQEWTWSERYASQPEILSYARHVVDRFDLRRDIRFDTAVTALRFDPVHDRWAATLSDGSTVDAQWVVLATGALSTPKPIDIPGAEEFRGEVLHTAEWPHEPVSFAGKRVAVIGTGSSGIQVATEIAKDAEHLYVLQRTPSYSMPARNRPLTPDEVARWKARYPDIREAGRHSLDGLASPMTGKNAFEVDEHERRARYEEIYRAGLPFAFFGVFDDVLVDDDANRSVEEFLAEKIRERVDDPALAEKLIPSGAPFGTRRSCLDSGYYEIFNQRNVTLVALRESPIVSITPRGIDTTRESLTVDAIVYATGYDAFTGTPTAIDIVGAEGATLAETWADGARSYLGLMVAGFPNLFLVTGPQSPSVLSNVIVSIEQHVEWITRALADARRDGVVRMEATRDAEQEWVDHTRAVAESTVYRDASSWYVGANVAGKPRVVLPYVGGVGGFRERCEEVAADGYRGFARRVRELA